MPEEEAYKRIREYGYEPIDHYVNNRTRMRCYDSEGYIIKLSLDSLGRCKTYQRFSPTCNAENFVRNLNLWGNNHNFKSKVIGFEPSLVTPKHYDLICECNCENHTIFKVRFENWKRGEKTRCNTCTAKISNIELKVKDFLEKNQISYIPQYKFKGCKDKRLLPFDFYLTDYNCCIEVDGEQHFYNYSNIYSHSKRHDISFEDRLNKDKIKDYFCKNNGILLIRLKYDKVRNNDYEQILKQQLNLH